MGGLCLLSWPYLVRHFDATPVALITERENLDTRHLSASHWYSLFARPARYTFSQLEEPFSVVDTCYTVDRGEPFCSL